MENNLFEDFWFQKQVYKKQNYGKIIFIHSISTSDKNSSIVSINFSDWNGENIKSSEDATFIEAIDNTGDIVFIYNVPDKILYANNNTYYECQLNKIPEIVGDSAHRFFKGDKLEEYNFKIEKENFITNKLLNFKGGLYYILSQEKETICIGGSHNDLPSYDTFTKYLVYDGTSLYKILYEQHRPYYSTCTKIHPCIMLNVDKDCEKYNIKLHS